MQLLSGLSFGQVLQRRSSGSARAHLRGICGCTGEMVATIRQRGTPLRQWSKRSVGKASRGRFHVRLTNLPVGGPYRLDLFCGNEHLSLEPFFVGDVWLLAGQSNMEGMALRIGALPPHPLVRSFGMNQAWSVASDPLHLLAEAVDAVHYAGPALSELKRQALRTRAQRSLGVGRFFAHEMLRLSGSVPQGLLCAAHGGTNLQQWSPALKHRQGGSLYGSMLRCVQATGQPVAGLLWYQGEGETTPVDAPLYTTRMRRLVSATRRDLRQPRLPWVIVQLGRIFDAADPVPWNSVREQQRLLPESIRYLETVSAIDLPQDDPVHLGHDAFARLAQRLARAANRIVYRDRREKRPPQLQSVSAVKQSRGGKEIFPYVDVTFRSVVGGLQSHGSPSGFAVIDSRGRELPFIYRVTLQRHRVRLHLSQSVHRTSGLRLTYGQGLCPLANLTDARGDAVASLGPVPIADNPGHTLPFLTKWRVGASRLDATPLDLADRPRLHAGNSVMRHYGVDGFINEHDRWIGRSGRCDFTTSVRFPIALTCELRLGYDSPFHLWIDGRSVHCDLQGAWPCLIDAHRCRIKLPAGRHKIAITQDLNGGLAWGFFLRLSLPAKTPAAHWPRL